MTAFIERGKFLDFSTKRLPLFSAAMYQIQIRKKGADEK